jgi:hypothetical protein
MSNPRRRQERGPLQNLAKDVFFISATPNDHQRIVCQRSLQRLRFIPRRAHPRIAFFVSVRITGIAFG